MIPGVKVIPASVALSGGLDQINSPMLAKPGSAAFALNYEAAFGGGYQRAGGIERFSGRPSPHKARYQAIAADDDFDIAVGDVVTGQTSAATGICVYKGQGATATNFVALSKVTGTFATSEVLQVSGTARGTSVADDPLITLSQDNEINAAAANLYRADILKVPGDGPIRGLASLNGKMYAWRDDGAAMKLYESSTGGWVEKSLGEYVTFVNASAEILAGQTITRGGVTATVLRVALETGDFTASNSGKLIIGSRTGGSFTAGAATASGGQTFTVAPQVAIALLAGGRVQTDIYNFTASLDTMRLYGCDGVNAEFEFDGSIYVPLTTGMPSKATAVRCHKNHVFFGFRGSLQFSGIADPYRFEVVSGAGELGTGDVITAMLPVAGSENAAAMLVLCENSAWALFGNDSADFQFTPLSREAGATAYSGEDAGTLMVHDTPGFRPYTPTDRFGNFEWNLASRLIDPLVQNKTPLASCFSKAFSRYRCFFSDGTAVSATPGSKGWEWSTLDYGRNIVMAWSGEVSGETRTFYGDDQGWIYEADVGRSFDGDEIAAFLKLHGLNQGQGLTDKTYRWGVVESIGDSPFELMVSAQFNDGDSDKEDADLHYASLKGFGAQWDSALWDRAYWDASRLASKRVAMSGGGYNVAPIFASRSSNELPHQIKTFTVFYTPRRVRRG